MMKDDTVPIQATNYSRCSIASQGSINDDEDDEEEDNCDSSEELIGNTASGGSGSQQDENTTTQLLLGNNNKLTLPIVNQQLVGGGVGGPTTIFRLHFLGSVEVEEEGGRKRRKRLKKHMVEEAVTKIKVRSRLPLISLSPKKKHLKSLFFHLVNYFGSPVDCLIFYLLRQEFI